MRKAAADVFDQINGRDNEPIAAPGVRGPHPLVGNLNGM
jgi:hypothetical protein